MHKLTLTMMATLVMLSLTAVDASAQRLSAAGKCEAAKNQEAGKYAACLHKAEARRIKTRGICSLASETLCFRDDDCPLTETCINNTAKVDAAVEKCETKFEDKWGKLEAAAAKKSEFCPDGLLVDEIRGAVDVSVANVAAALAGEGLTDCAADLTTCSDDLTTCDDDFGTCTGDLGTATADLASCNGGLGTCTTNLGACNAGTAIAGDVLSSKTFSSSVGLGASGTMPNRGAVSITPGTSAQTIAAGYHNGSGSVAGDADLVAGNIRSGVNLFGVNGSSTVVNTSGATAVAGDILTGKTAYVSGSLVTGNVAAGANVSGANGSRTFTIPNGLYTGSRTATANDTDLVASNILSGVNIFGVTGSVLAALRLKTGQTQCWSGLTVVSCAGTGHDGELQKGLTVSHTTNVNGTITDNRTGLVWERLNDGGGINDKDATFTWENAFNKVKVLNGNATGCIAPGNPSSCCTGAGTGSGCSAFAGFTDWRLPNIDELQSLANYGTTNPAVHAAFNSSCTTSCTTCSCTQSAPYSGSGDTYTYWSATTRPDTPSLAWWAYFGDGYMSAGDKTSNRYVRAVRGGS